MWSIDVFGAPALDDLPSHPELQPLLRSADPAYLHRKDPNLSPGLGGEPPLLLCCAHPFSWCSSASGYAWLMPDGCQDQNPDFFPRGPAWAVAACRITCRLPVPPVGAFRGQPAVSLYFCDGAECLRPRPPHAQAVDRPRGHSCEELGGLAWGLDARFPRLHRVAAAGVRAALS